MRIWPAARRRNGLSRARTQVLYPQYDAYERPTRRGFAVAGVGLAVAGAAAGTYLAIAGGLAGVLAHPPAAATARERDRPPSGPNGRQGVLGAQPPASVAGPTTQPSTQRGYAPPQPPPTAGAAVVPVPTPAGPSSTPSTGPSDSPSPSPSASASPSVAESAPG